MKKGQSHRIVAWTVGRICNPSGWKWTECKSVLQSVRALILAQRLASAAGLAVIFLIGIPGCSGQPSAAKTEADKQTAAAALSVSDQPARVKVVRPTREHLMRLSTPQPAHVGPYEKTDIYARVAGYLDSFGQVQSADSKMRPVDIGDRVAKDQVLATLSVPEMEQERRQKAALVDQAQAAQGQAEASLAAAEAMIEAAKAKLEESTSHVARYEADLAFRKGEYDRYDTLVKERAARQDLADEKLNQYRAAIASHMAAKAALVTDHATIKVEQAKFLKAKADVTSAKAHLKVAQANFEQTVIMLNYAVIKAPYDGVITRRLVDTGAFVQSAAAGKAEPLFTLARVDRLRIIADIPEAEASLVKLGQTATLQVNASRGQHFNGKVVRFADALDSGTRTMRTEVELDRPAANLRPGTFGSVTIVLADHPDAILLPTSALLVGSSKPAVMIVKDGKAHSQEVDLGYNDGVRIQINRGLTGDEQVITDGKNSVREGQPVEIAK